jgi:hypothetical protein
MVIPGILSAYYGAFLTSIDVLIAAAIQSTGCPHCKGPLHAAHYQRRPRGHGEPLAESATQRPSWCCGREGCRRRLTPPSIRYWGQTIYASSIVLALQCTEPGSAAEAHLRQEVGCSRQSVSRWRERFRGVWETSTGRILAGGMTLDGHERKQPRQVMGLWHGPWPYVQHSAHLLCDIY